MSETAAAETTPEKPPGTMISRKEGGIGWMIYDQQAKYNAVTYDMRRAIPGIMADFEADDEVRVVVIAGADKGKVTNVVEVFTKTGEVLCKDVNVKTKHVKPRGEGETGQIIQREFPIHHSNVMHYSEAKSVRSRIGTKEEGGKKVRVLKKTGEVLAN